MSLVIAKSMDVGSSSHEVQPANARSHICASCHIHHGSECAVEE